MGCGGKKRIVFHCRHKLFGTYENLLKNGGRVVLNLRAIRATGNPGALGNPSGKGLNIRREALTLSCCCFCLFCLCAPCLRVSSPREFSIYASSLRLYSLHMLLLTVRTLVNTDSMADFEARGNLAGNQGREYSQQPSQEYK